MKDTRGEEDWGFGALHLAADLREGGFSATVDEWAPSEAVCAPLRETRVWWVPVRVVEREPLSFSFSRSASSGGSEVGCNAEEVEVPGNEATVVVDVFVG